MFWVTIAALVVAAAIVFVLTRRTGRGAVVLGGQLAVAHANEAARLASGTIALSPMPKGKYDQCNNRAQRTSQAPHQEGPVDRPSRYEDSAALSSPTDE